MKIYLYPKLEAIFTGLAAFFDQQAQRVAICTDCGQNRYTGKPCVNFKPEVR